MPRPRRIPWFAVDVDIRGNEKITALPSDTARYGWIAGVLAEAKRQKRQGVFVNGQQLAEVIGRFARFIPQYLSLRLLELAPGLCADCKADFGPVPRGAIVVHNWIRKQHDPTHAVRQAGYRARESDAESDAVRDGSSDGSSDADGDGDSDANVTAGVTANPRAQATHARGIDSRQETVDREPPRESSIEEVGALARDAERPDVALLLERFKFKSVTKRQLRILDEIADNERASEHDVASGWRWCADRMAETPEGTDPLEHLVAVENALKRERLAAAMKKLDDWDATKAEDAARFPRTDDWFDPPPAEAASA